MKIRFVHISSRARAKQSAADALTAEFLTRSSRYTSVEATVFETADRLFGSIYSARTPTHLILLDSRGKLLSSEAFAAHLGQQRDAGTQHVMLAIGPADGWTDVARARADLLLSLGPMTLPHELARVVLAEQVYRALTILAGHPYHTGH